MRPDSRAWKEYLDAFTRIIQGVAARLAQVDPKHLPVRLYVAGGAALHLRTGARLTEDIDGVFSRKVVLGEELRTAYRDPDGRARFLYLDRNYNDTLGLMHENAYRDSERLELEGIDSRIIEVRVLSPVDLAVSKLARYGDQDREDIEVLAREGLVDPASLRRRAEEALRGYVGNVGSVQVSIDLACRLVGAVRRAPPGQGKKRRKR